MKYAKIDLKNVVVQIQQDKQDSFVEVDDNVVCGMVQTKTGFENPPKNINDVKDEKTNEINTACGNEIVSGFVSNALGTVHNYQSEQIDQLNLIGVVTGGVDDYFKCSIDGVNYEYKLHTVVQLTQVLNDGKAYKQTLLQKANGLKVQVVNAATLDEVAAVVWG